MILNKQAHPYSEDKKISIALMASFVVLTFQYFVLIYFDLLDSEIGSVVQLVSKIIVGLPFLYAFPTVFRRSKMKIVIIYGSAIIIFLLNYVSFSENRNFLHSLIFPLFFMSLPAFVYSLSLRNLSVLKKIMKYTSYIVFIIGLLISIVVFSGNASIGSYSMSLSYYMLLPAIMFSDELLEDFSAIPFILTTITLIIILALGSRGAVLCLIVFLALKLLRPKSRVSYKNAFVYVTAWISGLFFLAFYKVLLKSLLNLFQSFGLQSRTLNLLLGETVHLSGRDEILSKVWKEITADPLKGIGLVGDTRILGRSYVHNFFVEVIGNYGIVIGIIISIIIIVLLIKAMLNNSKLHYNMIIIWVCLGFVHLMVSSSYLIDLKFWVFLGLVLPQKRNYTYHKPAGSFSPYKKTDEKEFVQGNPLVSICCVTYNHEKYISDAIDSFLAQNTNFPFEIIIHDDASTDETPNIIMDYYRKYPNIINPILQTENQYTQGKKPLDDIIVKKAKGKYLATCEGDDYWIDPNKLQKQVDYLESNPESVMCFHKVRIVNTKKISIGRYYGACGNASKIIKMSEAAQGGIIHVSSRVIRSECFTNKKPHWISNARHGDYAIALYLAAEGNIFYINEVMSAYRFGVDNSMMTKYRKNLSSEKEIEFHRNRIATIELADSYYNYQYHNDLESVNNISRAIINLLRKDYSREARMVYRSLIKHKGVFYFGKLLIQKKFPTLFAAIQKIKQSLNHVQEI